MMNKQRFSVVYEKFTSKDIIPKGIMDNKKNNHMCRIEEVCDVLNEQDKEIGLLRLELDTHRHPLWSTREAERKLSEVTDNLANEVKKNGLLNEEINQLRIENMRLKKKVEKE